MAAELARLEHQARILAPATRTILQLAGIAAGMRVLDLGTGAGDVALQVAELVSPTGSLVGLTNRTPRWPSPRTAPCSVV